MAQRVRVPLDMNKQIANVKRPHCGEGGSRGRRRVGATEGGGLPRVAGSPPVPQYEPPQYEAGWIGCYACWLTTRSGTSCSPLTGSPRAHDKAERNTAAHEPIDLMTRRSGLLADDERNVPDLLPRPGSFGPRDRGNVLRDWKGSTPLEG
jgi:hypothetical protein